MQKELQSAIQYLYGQGTIKKDKDIADATGYNKATVSSYVSGRTKPSRDFIAAFQKAFGVRLEDFKTNGSKDAIKEDNPLQLISERVLQLYAAARVNQSLLVEVLANQTGKTVLELQRVVSSAVDAELKQLLDELRRKG